jgi:DNA-binding transcriptional LysR family regulator
VDLRQLAYFLAVVDHGGVTPAAAALHVAQPSLSQAIRGLEQELKVALFERDARGLTLTAAGEALVAPARQAQGNLAAARAAVEAVVAVRAGWLDLAVPDVLGADPASAALAAFHQRYPGVAVRLHSPRHEEELVRLILDGRCELGLSYLPISAPGLHARELGTHELWVALPPDWPVPADPVPIAALDGLPLVLGVENPQAVRAAVRAELRAARAGMRPAVVTRHWDSILPLVLAGAGAAFVPPWYAAEAARDGALTRRLDPPVTCAFGLLHRPSVRSPAATAFETVLADLPQGLAELP